MVKKKAEKEQELLDKFSMKDKKVRRQTIAG